jgi:hypothetical protein
LGCSLLLLDLLLPHLHFSSTKTAEQTTRRGADRRTFSGITTDRTADRP